MLRFRRHATIMIVTLSAVLFSIRSFADAYLFSAPPTESRAVSIALYTPIAELLSEEIGAAVRYEYSENWPNYTKKMQSANYDLVLDTAHLVSWRIEKIEHSPVVSISDNLTYVLAVKSNSSLKKLADLRGKKICGSAVPSLDALTVLDQYASRWSLPIIKVVKGFDNMWEEFNSGSCEGIILPMRVLEKLQRSEGGDSGEIIFQSFPVPHLALSASARMNQAVRDSITRILTSPAGFAAISRLRDYYGLSNSDIVPRLTNEDEYRGYSYLLSDFWGF